MSSQTRSSGGGVRQSKKTNSVTTGPVKTVSSKKTENPKTEKEKVQAKPTAEQMRIAQITDINSGSDDPKLREKVVRLMETTHRSEEDVCCALYECDNDLDRAVIFLFETLPVGAFTSSKKKKNRLTSGNGEAIGDEWGDNGTTGGNNNNDVRERSRNRTGMRGGRGGSDSRGWRGRESRENDRNAADNRGERTERGERWQGGNRGRGGFRGGYGSRGGRGGRMGPRGANRENNRSNFFRSEDTHEVDTWDNSIACADQNKPDDAWGDWDNEEYTGSLADTKVFTPSTIQNQAVELSAPPGLEQQLLNPPSQLNDDLVQYSATVVSSTATAGAVAAVNNNQVQYPEIHGSSVALRQALDMPQINASLSVEQSQYFNSLSSQNSNQQASLNAYQVPQSVQYPTSYTSSNSFVDQVVSSQQAPTRKQRARVPPPSKIPSSAVEMPGDTLNNIGYLDVQFGGLEFGNEESFDPITEKFNASLDNSQTVSGDVATDYQTKSSVQQQQNVLSSQMIPSGNVQSSQSDGISTGYNQRVSSVQQSVSVGSAISNSAALEQLTKGDHYGNTVNSTSTSGYHNQSAYNNNVVSSKSSGYQTGTNQQGYNNSNYSQQASTGNSYSTAASNTFSSYNQSGVNSYQQSNSNSGSGVNSSSGVTANNVVPVGSSGSVNNSSSNSNSGYLTSQYPSNQTSSTYPSQPSNVYQSSQTVYGNTGLSNNTGYANSSNVSSTASQYSNFSNTKLKETTPVTTIYESSVSSAPNVVANSTITTSTMSSPSLGLTNTKVTSSSAKSSGMVPSNLPMVNQYIQTAGMQFYQQPLYSYEDLQMIQPRIAPHVPGYYDMNYQTPTSLGAAGVRDGNIGSVAAYSDGRFTRTDNNSSPVSNVPSTMSQQTGSAGAMYPYPYFYPAAGFQFGPQIFQQQLPTANASSGAQFKASYNSGYNSTGYDTLSQSTQDYSKGAYPGSGVGQQSKGQNVTNAAPTGTASDISSSMYGKNHVALNKVNSYDKQSFHSATPPPFNLTGNQTAGANSQAYNAQHLYIQPLPPAGHLNMNMHQPIHQMDGRVQNASRRDSNSTGQRQQSSSQNKSGSKPGYSPSYWQAQN